ncbi:MAG TPA: zinc-binding alcohol dehydrogenase, partial [Chloroflexi bacterium]|nr:zinc-binding alcohol dehydrogenase [Chloroflexota bacterium]
MPEALYLVGPRTLEWRAYDDPPLGPRDVRLQSVMSGISHGTELNLYRGSSPFAEKYFDGEHRLFRPHPEPGFKPTRLGYEMVSRVVEVGDEVTSVKVGDLVHTATPHQPTTLVNVDLDAQAQIPMQVLPRGVSPEEGVFASLIGVALVGVHDAQIKLGDHVTVFGLGAIGLIVVQLARLSGAMRVTAVDPISSRRDAAARLGADEVIDPTQQDPAEFIKLSEESLGGADIVIEASGHYGALQGALRCAHMGGTVVTLGYYQGGATPVYLGEEWHHNRLNLVSSMGVWNCPSRYYPMWDRRRAADTVLDLLYRGMVDVASLVTQRFPYEQAPDAYHFIDAHPAETIKAVLT